MDSQVARRLFLIKHPQCSTLSGGQAIELLAKDGDRMRFPFRTPMGQTYDCCFSFAGLRNQVTMTIVKKEAEEGMRTPKVWDMTTTLMHQWSASQTSCYSTHLDLSNSGVTKSIYCCIALQSRLESFMLLVSAVLFLLWRVKVSAVKHISDFDSFTKCQKILLLHTRHKWETCMKRNTQFVMLIMFIQ